MKDILKCKICKNPFDTHNNQAYIIDCGHTYCKSCLMSNFEHLRCPTCGVDVTEYCIPNKIIDELIIKKNRATSGNILLIKYN